MKNLIQNFGMEILSKDEMKHVVGGARVTCDVCYGPNDCVGTVTAECPGSPSSCNGRTAGSGTTLQNCRPPHLQ